MIISIRIKFHAIKNSKIDEKKTAKVNIVVKTSTNNPSKTETTFIKNTNEIEHPIRQTDKENMFTNKIDLDYIPGLDDDLKVIIPGKYVYKYTNMKFFLLTNYIIKKTL